MTTLSTVALNVAKMLGRVDSSGATITDLGAEIKDEIRNTIRHYNRKPWHLTETRQIQFSTALGTIWYDEGQTTQSAAGGSGASVLSGNAIILSLTDAISFSDLIEVDYIRETSSSLNDQLRLMPYREFERFFEGGAVGGVPYAYTRYGGSLGIYPTPQAVYTIQLSGKVKGTAPTTDAGGSVWFDEAQELIETATAGRVCLKYTQDSQRAAEFGAIAAPLEDALHAEFVRKSSTGRIRAHS